MATRKTVFSDGLVVNGVTGNVSVEIHANDAIQLPRGTDAQRPTGAMGMFRYNGTGGWVEVYTGSTWQGYVPNTGGTFSGNTNLGGTRNRLANQDSLFYADMSTAVPTFNFGTSAALTYNRSTNTYNWSTGNYNWLSVNSSVAFVNTTLNANDLQVGGSSVVGTQAIYISASAMYPRDTNGAATGQAELGTYNLIAKTYDFDTTTAEYIQFEAVMPSSWNEGTITFQPVWSHTSGGASFGVVWTLEAAAFADGDSLTATDFGTAVTSTDTGGTADDIYKGPESAAMTVAGSPTAGELVQFQLYRDTGAGSDTLDIDARLHGLVLYITTDALTD